MARQFIFKSEHINKIDKAYLKDMLCFSVEDNNSISKTDDLYKLTGDELKHIQVLRHKVGDNIIINNMICILLHITKDLAIVSKLENTEEKGKPTIKVTLYPAFLKSDKMDYLVQKSVELGVTSIVPFFSKNTIVKLDQKDKIKRHDKLQKISIEATKQCGRTDKVEVEEFKDFKDMLKIIPRHNFCIFAYENETIDIKSVINNLKGEDKIYDDIAIIIGPEGGFDLKEVQELGNIKNVYPVSLGERILRAETASMNLISIIMYEFDNNCKR
jgi:16S rRNA (uracil1498-N3)-methyltransferase